MRGRNVKAREPELVKVGDWIAPNIVEPRYAVPRPPQ